MDLLKGPGGRVLPQESLEALQTRPYALTREAAKNILGHLAVNVRPGKDLFNLRRRLLPASMAQRRRRVARGDYP